MKPFSEFAADWIDEKIAWNASIDPPLPISFITSSAPNYASKNEAILEHIDGATFINLGVSLTPDVAPKTPVPILAIY